MSRAMPVLRGILFVASDEGPGDILPAEVVADERGLYLPSMRRLIGCRYAAVLDLSTDGSAADLWIGETGDPASSTVANRSWSFQEADGSRVPMYTVAGSALALGTEPEEGRSVTPTVAQAQAAIDLASDPGAAPPTPMQLEAWIECGIPWRDVRGGES